MSNSISEDFKSGKVILEMKGIIKKFPGVIANDKIDFNLKKGETHSILGENGSGKTTLMNILYGLYQMDEGEIRVWGKKVDIKSPQDAIKLGIGMVHQSIMLVPTLKVIENIVLGYEPTNGPFIDMEKAKERILDIQKKFNLKVDLEATPWQISTGEKQKVEIIKALFRGAEILVLDEPTAFLCPIEKRELIKTLQKMSQEGLSAVPFITHKLPEVIELSDRITVLRKGKVIDTFKNENLSKKDIAKKMVGREVLFKLKNPSSKKGDKILEIKNVKALNERNTLALKEVSLSVRRGEIVGIAGVSGNGQKELVEVIMGLRKPMEGQIIYKGKDITSKGPKEKRELGIGYLPESARVSGIVPECSIAENLILGLHRRCPFADSWLIPWNKNFFVNEKEVNENAENLIEQYDIQTPTLDKLAGKLSGGNIQRLMLAREFSHNPDFLLVDKPTAGLDVGSQEYIRNLLLDEKKKGKGILLISEDLDEIMMISDRIAVIYEGKIVSVLNARKTEKEEIGLCMIGKEVNQ